MFAVNRIHIFKGKCRLEQFSRPWCLQGFEFSRAFLPPVSQGKERGKQ